MCCFVKCHCVLLTSWVVVVLSMLVKLLNYNSQLVTFQLPLKYVVYKHYILLDLWPYRWFSAPASGVLHISESKEWERLKPHIHHESRSWILLLQHCSYQPQGNQKREHLAWKFHAKCLILRFNCLVLLVSGFCILWPQCCPVAGGRNCVFTRLPCSLAALFPSNFKTCCGSWRELPSYFKTCQGSRGTCWELASYFKTFSIFYSDIQRYIIIF